MGFYNTFDHRLLLPRPSQDVFLKPHPMKMEGRYTPLVVSIFETLNSHLVLSEKNDCCNHDFYILIELIFILRMK